MKIPNKVSVAAFMAIVAIPSAVLAGFPQSSSYAAFVPNAAQLSGMPDELATTCLKSAMLDPNNVALQTACHEAYTARLDTRIRVDVRNQMPRARTPAVRRFTSSQSAWSSARLNVCKTKWAAELNPSSNSFGLAVSKCVADETYRRAVWIETAAQ